MKKNWLFPFLLLSAACLAYLNGIFEQGSSVEATEKAPSNKKNVFKVDSQPLWHQVDRIGINLALPNSAETGHIFRNLFLNSGFEGRIDRLLVIASQSDKTSFSDDKGWGYPDGYWKGASFEVRSGLYAGLKGIITDSSREGKNGYPQYFSDHTLPAFHSKDVIALTKHFPQDSLSTWHIPHSAKEWVKIDSNHPPESGGTHALLLEPHPHIPLTIWSYFDKEASRTGKLIPVNGKWNFSVWVKAEGEHPTLTVEFKRKGRVFLSKTIHPTPVWKKYRFDFTGKDEGPNAPLTLKLIGNGVNGVKIWIDDLFLGPIQEGPAEFKQDLVQLLEALKPSFIREQAALGDTLANRLAEPSKRQHWTLRTAGSTGQEMFSYSLGHFLQLCQTVKANPWIIVPTTFSDEEYRQLGQFLAIHAPERLFSRVILEFGKDNWNWAFRPTGIPHPAAHGAVADRAFQFILLGADAPTHFVKTVNGQYVDPPLSLIYLEKTQTADALAISPYFFNALDAQTSESDAIKALFDEDRGYVKQIAAGAKRLGKGLAVSEINLYPYEGTASTAQKNRFVTGSIAGTALAKKLLEMIKLGADPIMVFTLLQYDSSTWNTQDRIQLAGIVRSLDGQYLFRPTGLAMRMLNSICAGQVHEIISSESGPAPLTALAFTPENTWAAALVSTSEKDLPLELTFPDDNKPLPTSITLLEAASPFENNEEAENVTMKQTPLTHLNNRTVRLTLPPYSFAILNTPQSLAKTLDSAINLFASIDSTEDPHLQKERKFLEHFEKIRRKRFEFQENAP